MSYRDELEKEIKQCQSKIDKLYEKLNTKNLPTKEWFDTYSEIFAIQCSIASKQQRIENMGKAFTHPYPTPKNVIF